MKKITLLLLMLAFAIISFAQQTISYSDFSDQEEEVEKEDQIQTVMSSFELKRISGFGGPTVSYTAIDGEFAVMSGGGGGVIINNLFLGGYGEGLSNYVKTSIGNVEFGHGGFWAGYEIAPHRMFHPVISTRMGWGKAKGVSSQNAGLEDGFFAVVPTVSLEINFTQFFKFNLGAEYRRTFGIDNMGGLSDNNFSNAGVYMSFIFGWF
jgi:hypothetical protein